MKRARVIRPAGVPHSTPSGPASVAVTHLVALVPLLLAIPPWIAALSVTDPSAMTDIGLLSVLPPGFYVALGLIAAGACLAFGRDNLSGFVPAAYVAAWIAIVHATPSILYGSLRYSWAWKHVGIVEYIQRTGRIDPEISLLPVYHNWPGFFGAAALLTEAAGLPNALVIATWAPPAFEICFAAGVFLIARASTHDRRLAWLAVWFFVLANWIGQDYFSPQALAYAIWLVIIGICLWIFPEKRLFVTPVVRLAQPWRPVARTLTVIDRLTNGHVTQNGLPSLTSTQRRGLFAFAILLLAVIAVTHQLTPVMAVLTLSALALVRRRSAWSLPLLAGFFAAAWVATGAAPYASIALPEIIRNLGQPDANINANLIDPSQFSSGARLVSSTARGVTALVSGLALLGWLRWLQHRRIDLSLTLLAVAPAGVLVLNDYGGETLFRVYFFALPPLAVFIAAIVYPSIAAGRTIWQSILSFAISTVIVVGSLTAYYGHEQSNYFPPGEIAAASFLISHAESGSLIVEGSSNYPSRHDRYEQFDYLSLVAWSRGDATAGRNAYSLADIEAQMASDDHPAAYLILTRSQVAGLSLPGAASIADLRHQIEISGDFTVIFENVDATIYVLVSRTPRANP